MTADPAARRRLLDHTAEVGLDHVTVGDHISFHGGTGFDGLISAASVLSANDDLSVLVGIYLLGLRHPMLAARQLATISEMAPGRLILGVGVGGEDRSEISNSGADPSTRGRRLDECLALVRRLLTGEEVSHKGEFFTLERAVIQPAPTPNIPIIVGGKGDVAVRRTVEFADGWLAIFSSQRRFAQTRQQILDAAAATGRPTPTWFGLSVWCGLDSDAVHARQLLETQMEALYRLPPEKFRHIAAAGTPAEVADWLGDFVEAGAEHLTLIPCATSAEASIDHAAEVRQRLLAAWKVPPMKPI